MTNAKTNPIWIANGNMKFSVIETPGANSMVVSGYRAGAVWFVSGVQFAIGAVGAYFGFTPLLLVFGLLGVIIAALAFATKGRRYCFETCWLTLSKDSVVFRDHRFLDCLDRDFSVSFGTGQVQGDDVGHRIGWIIGFRNSEQEVQYHLLNRKNFELFKAAISNWQGTLAARPSLDG